MFACVRLKRRCAPDSFSLFTDQTVDHAASDSCSRSGRRDARGSRCRSLKEHPFEEVQGGGGEVLSVYRCVQEGVDDSGAEDSRRFRSDMMCSILFSTLSIRVPVSSARR